MSVPLIERATRYKLVSGIGRGRTHLNAFDAALVDAGVGNYNLLRVSSILPPAATQTEDLDVPQGCALLIAYGYQLTSQPGEHAAAAVAVSIPSIDDSIGVITEYELNGAATHARQIVRDMAVEAMELRGIEIKEVLDAAAEVTCDEGEHVCAFAGVALF